MDLIKATGGAEARTFIATATAMSTLAGTDQICKESCL